MTTINRERVAEFIKNPLDNGLTRGEQMELARIALASLEAEAVAYIFKHPAGRLFWSLIDERNKGQSDVMPVYSAPVPAFVPPAIETDYEVIKGILPTANPDEYACCIAADMWNACRAAMLQGAERVSNRDELPGGWVACSERMPELDTRVLLYFPDYGGHIEDGCIGDEGDGHYHYFFDGDSLRHEPTHWMPMPAAPQQEMQSE